MTLDSNRRNFAMTKREQKQLFRRLSLAIEAQIELRDEFSSIKEQIETYEFSAHDACELLEKVKQELSQYL